MKEQEHMTDFSVHQMKQSSIYSFASKNDFREPPRIVCELPLLATQCWAPQVTAGSKHACGSVRLDICLTLLGLDRFFSARSTLVKTKMVLLPWGSIWLTRSVTMLRSASTEPSAREHTNTMAHKWGYLWDSSVQWLWHPTLSCISKHRLGSFQTVILQHSILNILHWIHQRPLKYLHIPLNQKLILFLL